MSKIEVNQISSQCGSTLTIGQSGDTIQLACGATQTGFGRTGTVDWDTTAKTASFTAVSGNGYFVNTTSGAVTVTLPASPSAGDIVALQDYAGTWGTNNVTIGRNGSNVGGVAGDAILSTSDQSITLVYVDATRGWQTVNDSTQSVSLAQYVTATGGTITTCGDYKIHTFTGPGTFCISCSGNPAGNVKIDYLVVAGGAGGSAGNPGSGGGGGAGGFRESQDPSAAPFWAASPLKSTTSLGPLSGAIPVTVGGGGAGGNTTAPCNTARSGTNGSNSSFSTITSAGGGGGSVETPYAPGNGGSGGGAANVGVTPGTGNTPPVSPPQGNNGGAGAPGASGFDSGGGGGGATVAGTAGANPGPAGPGGNGATTSISASSTTYAGGGGGGKRNCSFDAPAGSGGTGGGGAGSLGSGGTAVAGTTNTGGGGGAGAYGPPDANSGAAGGSGIVIIRYKYQ